MKVTYILQKKKSREKTGSSTHCQPQVLVKICLHMKETLQSVTRPRSKNAVNLIFCYFSLLDVNNITTFAFPPFLLRHTFKLWLLMFQMAHSCMRNEVPCARIVYDMHVPEVKVHLLSNPPIVFQTTDRKRYCIQIIANVIFFGETKEIPFQQLWKRKSETNIKGSWVLKKSLFLNDRKKTSPAFVRIVKDRNIRHGPGKV